MQVSRLRHRSSDLSRHMHVDCKVKKGFPEVVKAKLRPEGGARATCSTVKGSRPLAESPAKGDRVWDLPGSASRWAGLEVVCEKPGRASHVQFKCAAVHLLTQHMLSVSTASQLHGSCPSRRRPVQVASP